MSDSRRPIRLLIGIGLVLVGLLGGILLTLLVEDDPAPPAPTRIVKQVDSTPQSQQSARADSGLRSPPSAASLSEKFQTVAERVTPAVVSIRVRKNGGGGQPNTDFNSPPNRRNLGSGVLISPEGYIVTNNHVVKDAGTIQVQLADKRQFDARIVGTSASTDLAVVKIDGQTNFPVLPFGNSERVQVGDWVVAVGNPFRLTSTVTAGIVSALGRQLNIIKDQFRIEDFIQTDAAINPGNSGGALVNMDGELIGINTAIASGTGGYEGYGFAIPSALVRRITTDLIQYGEVRRGYLGVSIQPMSAEVASEVGMDNIHGVYIPDVRTGSAADRAGLQEGDVIEAIDGERVNSPGALQSAVALHRPGKVVQVRVWREGTTRTFQVRLMGEDTPVYQNWLSDLRQPRSPSSPDEETSPKQNSPDSAPSPESSDEAVTTLDRWGVGLRPVGDREQSRFGIETGAYVAYVEKGRPAAAAGLPRDVVITALDDTPVKTPTDVQDYLADADEPVLVQVQRTDGTQAFYEIN